MKRVVIVDDETIVRVTLRSMIRWEDFGYVIEADFNGGKPALEYFESHTADLLITDMKMPDMDGISLMEQLCTCGKLPITIALSGYNEFDLVRSAFRVGAFDYLLKSDLSQESLGKLLETLNSKIFQDSEQPGKTQGFPGIVHNNDFKFGYLEGEYGIVLFKVDGVKAQSARFGEDLQEMLQKPVIEMARQLPRVASRGKLEAIDPFHYTLAYRVGDKNQYHDTILSVVRQLQSVWKDYMNVYMSAAVSEVVSSQCVLDALKKDSLLLYLAILYGSMSVCTEWDSSLLLDSFEMAKTKDEKLAAALYAADHMVLETEKRNFFRCISSMELSEAVKTCLGFIILLAAKFRENNADFAGIFPDEVNYVDKLGRLESVRELELWMNNYFSWVTNFIENHYDSKQADVILRARRFLADNFSNPELTLKNAADYVGLNEKYFSSRFTKEVGTTFSAYLTDLRMQKSKQLMRTTDLKMYEISERVGYHNVEHFNRMFKRTFEQSPGDYRKSAPYETSNETSRNPTLFHSK